MWYDINSKYAKHKSREEYKLSALQKTILGTICSTKDTDYPTLQKAAKRTRTTIIQSLRPLRKHSYVWTQKVEPQHTMSKLFFRPTSKGLFYAIAFLDVDSDKIIHAHIGEKKIKEYNEYIKSIPNYNARKEFLVQSARIFMKYDTFDRKGMFISKNPQEAISLGFRYSLLELAKGNNSELVTALGENPLEAVRKVCGSDEFKEARIFFQNYRDNIDSIVKCL